MKELANRTRGLWGALMLLGSGCGNGATAPNAHDAASSAGVGGTLGGAASAAGTAGLVGATGGALPTAGSAGELGSVAGAGGASARAGTGGENDGGTDGSQAGRAGGPTTGGAGPGGVSGTAGSDAAAGVPGAGDGGGGAAGSGAAAWSIEPEALVITGVRGVSSPVATTIATLHNAGVSALSVTALALTGKDAKLFQLTSPPALPASIAAGGELPLTLALLTSSADLPAAPSQNSGGSALTATLAVTLSAGSVERGLSGLVMTTATHEVTLGQILDTLGYVLDVGAAQDNANPNTGGTDTLPGVEANTDELVAPLFQKAGAGEVTLTAVARFSPKGPMPFGWYPKGAPDTRNAVGTMAEVADAQTSDKARMVLPPLTGGTTFDPGAATFGVWVYSDQASQKYDTGGSAENGDYDYSEDGPNSPANVHRTKVYPLKDASGALPNSFLLAVEEAANGDYQDYVLVLGNAKVAP